MHGKYLKPVSYAKRWILQRWINSIFLGSTLFLLFSATNPSHCLGSDVYEALDIERPSKVKTAPDFSIKDLDNKKFTLSQYKGKLLLLNFWATWCAPCIKEMPSLNNLHKKFKNRGLIVLGISVDNGMKRIVTSFVKKNNLLFPVFWDKEGTLRDMYEVYALPFTYLVDQEGRFIGRIAGEREWDSPDVLDAFAQLLK